MTFGHPPTSSGAFLPRLVTLKGAPARIFRQNREVEEAAVSETKNALFIDIPVEMKEVKSVHSVGNLQFEGDLPAALFHLQLITTDIAKWKATSDVIVVFHTNAGHVTLNDAAYNGSRNVFTGNPYKKLVADLIEVGVRVELCGATAKVNGWGNADLLPRIKINLDAMARTIQLVQQGYVKITE
jgi:intracellular sulfur oxidation DsrE/DsrF family protein